DNPAGDSSPPVNAPADRKNRPPTRPFRGALRRGPTAAESDPDLAAVSSRPRRKGPRPPLLATRPLRTPRPDPSDASRRSGTLPRPRGGPCFHFRSQGSGVNSESRLITGNKGLNN